MCNSIKDLGTPWAYNQTFTATYKAPFSSIPILSFISANASYNATYHWDRGTTLDGVISGNTIANQAALNFDTRWDLNQLYNKIPYLKDVNKRFSSSSSYNSWGRNNSTPARRTQKKKPKTEARTVKVNRDS